KNANDYWMRVYDLPYGSSSWTAKVYHVVNGARSQQESVSASISGGSYNTGWFGAKRNSLRSPSSLSLAGSGGYPSGKIGLVAYGSPTSNGFDYVNVLPDAWPADL